jgi:hypothetical protein
MKLLPIIKGFKMHNPTSKLIADIKAKHQGPINPAIEEALEADKENFLEIVQIDLSINQIRLSFTVIKDVSEGGREIRSIAIRSEQHSLSIPAQTSKARN